MTKRQTTGLVLLGLTAIGGIVFSGLLFYSSVKIAAGVTGSSICQVGSNLDCAPALASKYSSFLGIPLPILSGAFYFCVLGLVGAIAFTKEDKEQKALAGARFLLLTFGIAFIATIILLMVTITQLSAACPFCIGLYVCSGLGLGATFMLGPKVKEMEGFGNELASVFKSPVVVSALVVFVVAGGLSWMTYSDMVSRATAENEAEQRRLGEAEADKLTFEGEAEIDTTGMARLGPEDAPVKIIEFSDFECPYCARFSETVHQVHETYPDDVAVYFAHYPLDGSCNPAAGGLHPTACRAARAATCAQAQQGDDAFWEMHDKLFDFYAAARDAGDKPNLGEDDALSMAADMRLSPERFLLCINDPETDKTVVGQIIQGSKAGVSSTPAWFINGHPQAGAKSFAYIQPLIERLLSLRNEADGGSSEPGDDDENPPTE